MIKKLCVLLAAFFICFVVGVGLMPTHQVEAATLPLTATAPLSDSTYAKVPIDFTLGEAPLDGSVRIVFTGPTNNTITMGIASPIVGPYQFELNPKNIFSSSPGISSATSNTLADGVYTVAISYQNAAGDPAYVVTRTNVTINTTSSGILVQSYSPAQNASDVSTSPTLELTFNQSMSIGAGNINIFKLSDGSLVEAIDVSSPQVSGDGTITISVTSSALAEGTDYYVTIDSGALENFNSQPYVGFSNNSTWRFRTAGGAAAPAQEGAQGNGQQLAATGRGTYFISVLASVLAIVALVVARRKTIKTY